MPVNDVTDIFPDFGQNGQGSEPQILFHDINTDQIYQSIFYSRSKSFCTFIIEVLGNRS